MGLTKVERAREATRRWRANNIARARELGRLHKERARLRNSGHEKELHRIWLANNPDKTKAYLDRRNTKARTDPAYKALRNAQKLASNRRLKAKPETWITVALRLSRGSARERGLEHTVTRADIVVPSHCPVFGTLLVFGHGQVSNGPTLDRRDNSKGYVPGNVFVVSQRANTLKRDASVEDVKAILRYMEMGNGNG